MSNLITHYSNARKEIHRWLDSQGIPWNDNIVGRIGEYYAIDYINKQVHPEEVIPASKSNQEGYDFCVGHIRYSVKTITKENKTGSTTPIKLNESWDYLITVKLDVDFRLESLSLIDYNSLKDYLDSNSIKQGKIPSDKKTFRWWKILKKIPYKKI